MFKKAFTLAEVLITLGIIGIVAAMTMPVLMADYKKKAVAAQLKKVYSQLLQSVEISKVENGDINDWNWSLNANDFFIKYLASNFQIVKNCGNKAGCWNTEGGYKLSGGVFEDTPLNNNWYKIMLLDGTFIGLEKQDNTHVHIAVDLNGEKVPNTYGKDIFLMTLVSQELRDAWHNISAPGIYMYGHGLTPEEIKSASSGCSKDGNGLMCGEKILMDGWEIKNGYPWK